MAEKICSFCKKECEFKRIAIKKEYAGREYICFDCYGLTGINDFVKIGEMTADEIRPYIDEANESVARREEMTPNTYAVGMIEADTKNHFWSVLKGQLSNSSFVHTFDDIKSYCLVLNDTTYDREQLSDEAKRKEIFNSSEGEQSKHGLFSKAAKCSCLKIVIETDTLTDAFTEIVLIDKPTAFDSSSYRNACDNAALCFELIERMMNW